MPKIVFLCAVFLLLVGCVRENVQKERSFGGQEDVAVDQKEQSRALKMLMVGTLIPSVLAVNKIESTAAYDKYITFEYNGGLFGTPIYITVDKKNIILSIYKNQK